MLPLLGRNGLADMSLIAIVHMLELLRDVLLLVVSEAVRHCCDCYLVWSGMHTARTVLYTLRGHRWPVEKEGSSSGNRFATEAGIFRGLQTITCQPDILIPDLGPRMKYVRSKCSAFHMSDVSPELSLCVRAALSVENSDNMVDIATMLLKPSRPLPFTFTKDVFRSKPPTSPRPLWSRPLGPDSRADTGALLAAYRACGSIGSQTGGRPMGR